MAPMVRILSASVLLAAAALAAAAPVQYSGNGHYYDVVLGGSTFETATASAATQGYLGMSGHLATWEDAGELDFIGATFTPLIPANQGIRGFWLGAFSPAQGVPFSYVTGGLADTTGFVIDHAEGPGAEGLGIFNLGNPYYGDYTDTNSGGFIAGYVVEFQAVPEPAPLAALGLGAVAVLRRRKRA